MTSKEKLARCWHAVEFTVEREQEDLASWLLIQAGAKGCEVKQAGDSGLTLHCVFADEELSVGKLAQIKESLDSYGLQASIATLSVKTVVEEDWLQKWKQGYKQFAVGDRLLVCPSWLKSSLSADETAGRQLLVIEPGMAFGTGLHQTTSFCLRALEQHLSGPEILDVGTGSGILAIAAALLDCHSNITALDVDPVSIQVAQENFELNCVADRIKLLLGSTETVNSRVYNTVLSNLTCEDIVGLLSDYSALTAPGAVVICAGILAEKLPLLQTALVNFPFSEIVCEIEGLWAGLVLKKAAH